MIDQPPSDQEAVPSDQVFASVLAFNNHVSTLRTLMCLREQSARPGRVVVVDNGSTEPFTDFLARTGTELLPHEEVLRLEHNRGVGAGHNAAIQRATDDGYQFVWLLEHDTFVGPDCLQVLLSRLSQTPDPSMAAAIPILARNHYEAELLRSNDPLPGERPLPSGLRGHSITFNGLLLTTDLANRLGPIREDLVVGFEDYAYSRQMQSIGVELIEPPEVLGVHPNRGLGRYPEPQSPTRCYYAVRNFLWIRREETGRLPCREALRAAAGSARDLARGDLSVAVARIRGIRAGLSTACAAPQLPSGTRTNDP